MSMRPLLLWTLCVSLGILAGGVRAAERPGEAADIFARENLVAWCIVPFDARRRGPEERAAMLARLRIPYLAYDWRDEHIPTFDAEIEAMRQQGVEVAAWWFPGGLSPAARQTLDALQRQKVRTQLWVSMGDPAPTSAQAEKVQAAVEAIRPIAVEAEKIGCTVALYNHGGWFGEPENQVAIIQQLGMPHVGIVYNFHHGHDHIERFAEMFRHMQPHLLAVNLNGMIKGGDRQGKKILALGQGDQELQMMRVMRDSGWRGLVGIIDHREDTDSEVTLRENLEGLERLRRALDE